MSKMIKCVVHVYIVKSDKKMCIVGDFFFLKRRKPMKYTRKDASAAAEVYERQV